MARSTTNGKADPVQEQDECLRDELKDLASYFAPALDLARRMTGEPAACPMHARGELLDTPPLESRGAQPPCSFGTLTVTVAGVALPSASVHSSVMV